jgi:hypothetical protein
MLTPKSVQDRVIARKLAGQSNRQIARQLALHHGTVGKILSQAEVQVMLNEYRQSAIELVPKAIKVCSYRLDRKDGKIAIEVLKGTQVFVGRQEQEVHEKKDEFSGRTAEELEYYAQHGEWPTFSGSKDGGVKEALLGPKS